MISNTDLFYTRAAEYQSKRKDIMDAYDKRAEEIADTKGSRYYDDEMKLAEEKKNTALEALQNEYGQYFDISLRAMSDANARRGLVPPTAEQLRTLEALKMRESVTRDELDLAANTLAGNATCMSILAEIAHKNGLLGGYKAGSEFLTVGTVEATIKAIRTSVGDFMRHDTSHAGRMAAAFQERVHGRAAGSRPLPKRPLFKDKEECFYTLTHGLTGSEFKSFCEAVDG